MTNIYCERTNCKNLLLQLSDDPNYTSVSIRCKCGARYRVYNNNGEHRVDRVRIDDLSEATLSDIENDPTLTPSERVDAYESFKRQAKKARDSYNSAYGGLIHLADSKSNEWHKKASEQIAKVMSEPTSSSAVELVNNVAVAYTSSGKSLFVDGSPWDPRKMGNAHYVRKVAEQLGVAHILE